MDIATKLRERLAASSSGWTVRVRFTSTHKSAEFAITTVLDDGFMGVSIGRTQTGAMWVPYDKVDYIRILEEGDV